MASHSQSEWLLDIRAAEGPSAIPHEDTNTRQVKSPADHPRVNGLRRWCYSLHALLCILHLVLLVMLWSHPEHAFTIPFDNSILTVGLSAFLQAFYTLYTILLVFITQRLALSASLSRHQKLTTTHDISEAWGGLGAAILTLWQQTKIAASTITTILVFLYLACVSVLHVASPTIMQFQPYNASLKTVVASNSTWPGPSVNLSALTWAGISPLAPLMSNLNSSMLSTSGLVNTTLYDTFTGNQLVVNASVNATTIRANCGLLPILSSDSVAGINASLSAVENVTVYPGQPWKDEILFLNSVEYRCTTGTCAYHPLLFMVSTAMELDSSIQSPVSVNSTWQFTPIDGQGAEAQTSSTIVYPVACSLYALHHQSTLDMQHDIMWSTADRTIKCIVTSNGHCGLPAMVQTQNPSLWEFLLQVSNAEYPGLFSPTEFFCQQDFCPAISTIELYIMSLLGVNMEVAVSQVAAELIWLAGQLGETNGGFVLSPTSNDVTEQVPKWRLNVVTQFPDLSTEGLFASTLYDTPSATPASLDAVVSATTVHAHCGLLSNLSYDPTSWVSQLHCVSPGFHTYGCSADVEQHYRFREPVRLWDTLDLQSNLLTGPHPADMSAHSQPWSLWSPTNVSELDKGISAAMSNGSLANCPVDSPSEMQPCNTFTDLDFYIMAHVGINFENAVSEVAARLIWLAGRMDGGFQPAYGTSKVTDIIVQLQLNINIIPLGFALGASVTIFLLTFYIVGVTAPRSLAVSSLGVLETWWLESHSQLLHDRMLEIDNPSVNNLRSAGMLGVCLADELATTKGHDEGDQDDNGSMTEQE
ncbi:hypothetical protein J3R83DRAFT_3254 [Lanmaoa asiatica]|nr:hypothetical protein J3R83DRAFT_3254 [Lanmaoa asiatica]